MKLVYITAKKYPSAKADPFYLQSMAGAFARLMGPDFTFFVRGAVPDELKPLNARSVRFPNRGRTFFYFFGMPILVARYGWNKKDTYFFPTTPIC